MQKAQFVTCLHSIEKYCGIAAESIYATMQGRRNGCLKARIVETTRPNIRATQRPGLGKPKA